MKKKYKSLGGTDSGFTLIEILVVISILGIIATFSFFQFNKALDKARFTKAEAELRNLASAIEMYYGDAGSYPPNASPGQVPTGFETKYINSDIWNDGPWPGSVYSWDYRPETIIPPREEIAQISIRFCGVDNASACRFPRTDWASGLENQGALFYCIKGRCRSRLNSAVPANGGYCLNCSDNFPPYGFSPGI